MDNFVIWGVAFVGVLGFGWNLWRDLRRHDLAYGNKVACDHLERASQ